jgi:hypothetical protein
MTKLNSPCVHTIDHLEIYKQFKFSKDNYILDDICSVDLVADVNENCIDIDPSIDPSIDMKAVCEYYRHIVEFELQLNKVLDGI